MSVLDVLIGEKTVLVKTEGWDDNVELEKVGEKLLEEIQKFYQTKL